jgi:hypothetical protein
MNTAALKKLTADYLQKGKADYAAGRLSSAAKDYLQAEGVTLGYFDKMGEVYICELCQRAYEPEEISGVQRLKVFKGYTVDLRLQEFREMKYGKRPQFTPFASLEGRALLAKMHEEVTR